MQFTQPIKSALSVISVCTVLLASQFSLAADSATAIKHCYLMESKVLGRNIKYCVERTRPDLKQVPGEAVAYYFHGIFGSEASLYENGYADTISQYQPQSALPALTVISFETENLSYFIDINQTKKAYKTWFLTEFMPAIEKKYELCNVKSCRGLIGNSMGGLGTFFLAFQHPELFGFMANTAPVMLSSNIFDSLESWNAYFDRHPIGRLKGYYLLRDARTAFGTRENFDLHSIISIAKAYVNRAPEKPPELPALFFDVGGKDSYGFNEGFSILKDLLDRQNVPYESEYYPDSPHAIAGEPIRRERVLKFIADYFSKMDQLTQ